MVGLSSVLLLLLTGIVGIVALSGKAALAAIGEESGYDWEKVLLDTKHRELVKVTTMAINEDTNVGDTFLIIKGEREVQDRLQK